jgi:SAM-dependent methyltransferase
MNISQISKNIRNRNFTEHPSCALCGSSNREFLFYAYDGNPIVRCSSCSLHYTSPRPPLGEYVAYLMSQDNARNIRVTDNRMKYGVANVTNIPLMPKHWRRQLKKRNRRCIRSVIDASLIPVVRMHDVGCGVGFLLSDARDMGLTVTGNDLNGYACERMRNELGLHVFCSTVDDLPFESKSIDAIIAKDYLEHTWTPLADLKTMHHYLKPGGALHVETFHIDCRKYDELRSDWKMLGFNHVYHYSPDTLRALIIKAGFDVFSIDYDYEKILIKINAVKPLK